MRKILLLAVVLCSFLQASAQSIVAAEYYFDQDPGTGKATPLALSSETESSFTIPTTSLEPGFHVLSVRAKNSSGIWSLYQKRVIYIQESTVGKTFASAEYFWNTDPGVGNGTDLAIDDAATLDVEKLALTDNLPPGLHFLHIRLMDNSGTWTFYGRKAVHIFPTVEATTARLVSLEYSFDSIPATGQGMQQSLEEVSTLEDEFSFSTEGLAEGEHLVYVRVKDSNNRWSEAIADTFRIQHCAFQSPIAARIMEEAQVEQLTTVDLSALFESEHSGELSYSIIQEPTKAQAELVEGQLHYTPSPGTVGPDSLEYQLCNSCGSCSSAWAVFEIANQPPVLVAESFSAQKYGQLNIALLQFLTDPNNNIDPNSLTIISPPESGVEIQVGPELELSIDYAETEFSGTDQFQLRICDLAGACAEQTYTIEVLGETAIGGEVPELKVYNALSPNGDGKNDYLEIQAIEEYPDNLFLVFNRWGDKVFETSNYNNASNRFEGFSNQGSNSKLPVGTYYYQLHLRDQQQKISGFIVLKY